MSMMSIPVGFVTETCYVTHDLDAAMAKWTRNVGAGPWFAAEFPATLTKRYRGRPAKDSYRATMGFLGTSLIELVQPTNDAPSIFREILDTKGEGALHHLYPKVRPRQGEEYDRACAEYRAQGLESALSMVVPGLGRNDFFDATATLGCFIEVLEFGEDAYENLAMAWYKAHLNWDGSRPVRNMFDPAA